MPPPHDIAHVGHVEIRTPVPAESLAFFTRNLGLTENGGPTYVFTDPDGHELGLHYESTWYRPPAELRPALKAT